MSQYIIAFDQGTTSSRTIVFDENAQQIASAALEITQIYPQSGWVEHDPQEILTTQIQSYANCLQQSKIDASHIAGLGITNQRETTVVWDKKTGEPVYNAIVWQCRRTAPYVEELKADNKLSSYIQKNTGLVLDAYFSATKIKWILDNVDGAREKAERGDLLFGTTDSWLIWNLSEKALHITDYTNASRTLLFNIHTLDWDDHLLEIFSIPRNMLPQVHPSSKVYGNLRIQGNTLPLAGIAGDQQSALFGQRCVQYGDVKNTYGTGCFVLMHTGTTCIESKNGLITTLAATDGEAQYVLEGSVFIAGAIIQWLRDELKLIASASETESIAQSVEDSNGVFLVPAFVGLGSPHWDMFARGSLFGLTRGSNRAHIVRAALESIALQSNDLINAMEQDLSRSIDAIHVDGGASKNNFLMQFQADIGNRHVHRPANQETTALGAALLAGIALSYFTTIPDFQKSSRTFVPTMQESNRTKIISQWHKAVERSKNWIEQN